MNPEIDKLLDGVEQVIIVNELEQIKETGGSAENENSAKFCANCGALLQGRYCHACGQSAHIHHSLLHLLEELGHGLLHFDTKAWRTIPALILRPGQLTRDYIAGQRTRFVSPLALFLFMMFFMFFVFSFGAKTEINNELSKDLSKEASSQVKLELQTQLDEQEKMKAELMANNKSAKEQDALILGTKKALQEIELTSSSLSTTIAASASKGASAATATLKADESADSTDSVAEDAFDFNELGKDVTKQELRDNLQINIPFLSKDLIVDKIYHAKENKELALYKLRSGIAKFTFLLVPLSLPFFWLMFAWRRQYTMFDHAVFSLYSLSFMAVLFSGLSIVADLGFRGFAVTMFFIVPPIHIFRQLRQAYQLSFLSSLWRTMTLCFLATVIITFYILIVLGLSL